MAPCAWLILALVLGALLYADGSYVKTVTSTYYCAPFAYRVRGAG